MDFLQKNYPGNLPRYRAEVETKLVGRAEQEDEHGPRLIPSKAAPPGDQPLRKTG